MDPLRKSAIFLLQLYFASAQYYPFCVDGTSTPDFSNDSQVDVIFAQAPLFSTNPKIGDTLGLVNLYHTSLLFAQGQGSARRYWTLEFDFIGGNLIQGLLPDIVVNRSVPGMESLVWRNDARYCLTKGLLWGRKHWSKRFDVLMSIPANQAKHTFDDFMASYNSTSLSSGSQYQLWRVAKTNIWGSEEQVFVKDVTCADGAVWFVHHLASMFNPVAHIAIKATSVVIEATHVEAVNTKNPLEWAGVVDFYKQLIDLTSGHNKSITQKLEELAEVVFERKYVYDGNTGVYYAIYGNYIPWMRWKYDDFPLVDDPWTVPEVQLHATSESAISLVV